MRGLHWSEFIRFIQDNRASNSILKFYGPTADQPDKMTICDFDLPRRQGKTVALAFEETDWFISSQVVVGGWDGGYIPLRGRETPTPLRGAVSVLKTLIADGCVLKTNEVCEWLRKYDHP